jgi:CubicO group peptidase (beta-lactamase class C family)
MHRLRLVNLRQQSILCLTVLSLVAASYAQTARLDQGKARQKRAAAFINELMQKNGIPGVVVVVAQLGRKPWIAAFGKADVEQHVPARPETIFRVGSLSKLFTADAVVRLAQQGRLDLDADIRQYVPSFPAKPQPITARELAGHLAGIRHYSRNEYLNTEHQRTITENLARFQNDPLLSPPGTKYLYSSYGYSLLGAVVEQACKEEYTQCMLHLVFGPLGMKHTVLDSTEGIIPDRARPYSRNQDNALTNGPSMDTSDRMAAGGFASSALELWEFGAGHLTDGAYLTDASRRLLFTTQTTSDGKPTGVGFGWRIGKDSAGRTIYHHGGDTVGGRAFLLLYPDDQIVVVFLSNLSFAPFNEKTAERLVDTFR